jgi:GAF domain-containing protein
MPTRVGRSPKKAKGAKKTGAKRKASASKTRNMQEMMERLRLERDDARESQAASAAVLKIISASRGNLSPVFEAILVSALRICNAKFGHVLLYDGERFDAVHLHDVPQSYRAFWTSNGPIRPAPTTALGRLMRTKRVVHIPDLKADEAYLKREPLRVVTVEQAGARSFLGLPMLKAKDLIGAIVIYRQEVRPFSETEIQLLQTFADQAVIAIENTRLFNETKEALEQQTATAEILSSISASMTSAKPVFEVIVRNLVRLFGTRFAVLQTLRNDGMIEMAAVDGQPGFEKILDHYPRPLARDTVGGLAMLSRHPVQFAPVIDNPAAPEATQEFAREFGFNSVNFSPMLLGDKVVGSIGVAKKEAVPFNDKQIALIASFANQAVIAIENARLLRELRERTDDLSAALVYQTGSGNILKVIASSPTDVGPVLKAIVESACELCDAYDAVLMLKRDNELVLGAHQGPIPLNQAKWANDSTSVSGRAAADRAPVHVHDILSPAGDEFAVAQEMSRRDGCRTILGVPMLRENESIGAIVLRRTDVQPFSEKQVDLLQTFANQAVIAIGNVRLFEEVQARTHELAESLEQQTATSEVLSVISRSTGDLAPVFDAMLSKAMQLCGANFGVLNTYDGTRFHTEATYGLPPAYDEFRRRQPLDYGPATAPVRLLRGEPFVEIDDLLGSAAYRSGEPNRRALVDLGGARCLLAVPLLKDERVVGNVMIFRQENRQFSGKQIALLQQFAAQAVIAIENTRLLKELRQRTDDLSQSLNDLRTAQERLIQTEKLASLGQLTAGIAHEIKNPLNFVNNFAALSAELANELKDVLKPADIDDKMRTEVDELTGLLKGNLERVVQHGKRADSIVKNMLFCGHQRACGGEPQSCLSRRARRKERLQYHSSARLRCKRRFSRTVSAGDHTRVAESDFERLLCRDYARR